jgi:hypothetical protein
MESHLTTLAAAPNVADREARIERLVWCPLPMRSLLLTRWRQATGPTATALRRLVLEVTSGATTATPGWARSSFGEGDAAWASVDYNHDGEQAHLVVAYLPLQRCRAVGGTRRPGLAGLARRP